MGEGGGGGLHFDAGGVRRSNEGFVMDGQLFCYYGGVGERGGGGRKRFNGSGYADVLSGSIGVVVCV